MTTQYISFGKGAISNVSLVSGIDADVFVLNMVSPSIDNAFYRQRGGLRKIADLPEGTNTIFQFRKTGDIFVFARKSLYKLTSGGWLKIYDNLEEDEYRSVVSLGSRFFFNDGEIVYECDGENVKVAKYKPRKFLIAPNALNITAGSKKMLVRCANHGLNNGVRVSLSGFTSSYGGVAINQENLPIEIINDNSFYILYDDTFTETISDSGGNGIITAYFEEVNFPKASAIAVFQNRLCLAGDSENPDRLYISDIVTGDDINFDTEQALDLLNLSVATDLNRAMWIDVEKGFGGKIVQLYSATVENGNLTSYGLLIFKEIGVWLFTGDSVVKVLTNDSIVNKRAVDGDGLQIFFVGHNNIYRIQRGSIQAEEVGSAHEWYIKNAVKEDVRVRVWDNYLIVCMGDVRRVGYPIPKLVSLDGDSADFTHIENLALVLNLRNGTFTFFSGISPKDFEVIFREEDGTRKMELCLDSGNYLVVYDENFSRDVFLDFPKVVVTHIRYCADMSLKKVFDKVYLYGTRLADAKVFYKVIGDTGFNEALVSGDAYMKEATLTKNNVGRGIILYFGSFDNSGEVSFHGYQINFNVSA